MNGKRIFSHDIVRDKIGLGVVGFFPPAFAVVDPEGQLFSIGGGLINGTQLKDTEVIGNIFDNPDLIPEDMLKGLNIMAHLRRE